MRFRSSLASLVVTLSLFTLGSGASEQETPAKKPWSTLEVAVFDVNREDVSTEEAERAGTISPEMLEAIQRGMIGEISRAEAFEAVRKATDPNSAQEGVLVIGGKITDFKGGNRTARLLVGMGAGGQKIEAECVLKDKATGRVLGTETIVDRKVAGWAGGDETKGIHDFAEKVLAFIDRTIKIAERPASK